MDLQRGGVSAAISIKEFLRGFPSKNHEFHLEFGHFLAVCSCANTPYIAHVARGGCKFVENGPRGALFLPFPKVSPPIRIFFCAN